MVWCGTVVVVNVLWGDGRMAGFDSRTERKGGFEIFGGGRGR